MARPLRFLLALGAFFVLAAVLAACGSGVPGNAVARVDDEVIKRTTFNHWLRVAALSSQPPGAPGQVTVPDPPPYRKCIAAKRRGQPKPPPGQEANSERQLREQCRQEYEGMRDQVMQFLIESQWLQGAAAEMDISVPDREVQRSFREQKAQAFPNDADYQKFLRDSGMTQRNVLLRVRLGLIENKIREKVTKGRPITNQQIEAYYRRNKQRFTQPEQRDLLVVLAKTEARARSSRRAIEDGDPWAQVARRYSTDDVSKRAGGKLLDVVPGQQEQELDKAVFKAKRGELVGPVKTPFGFYVFRVTDITPERQQSLEQVRDSIRGIIQSENQQKALERFVKRYQKEWKAKTSCRKGYIVELCKNAPKPKRTTTSPPGAIPAPGPGGPGAPPGGAPPGQPPGAPPEG